jgi:hypothetical protein
MELRFDEVNFIPAIGAAPQDIGPMDYSGTTIEEKMSSYCRKS